MFTHLPAYRRSWFLVVESVTASPAGCQPCGCPWGIGQAGVGSARRKGQGGLLADPSLSDTARRMLLGLRGGPRPDGARVFFPLSPVTGGGMSESSGPPYRIPGLCRSCTHRQRGVECWIQAHVALMWHRSHHPSTEQRWLCALFPQKLKPAFACKSSYFRVKELSMAV